MSLIKGGIDNEYDEDDDENNDGRGFCEHLDDICRRIKRRIIIRRRRRRRRKKKQTKTERRLKNKFGHFVPFKGSS